MDAQCLYRAIECNRVDENTIIEILTLRTNEQRLEIAQEFERIYCYNVVEKLKTKLQGHVRELIVDLMTPLAEYFANEFHADIQRYRE